MQQDGPPFAAERTLLTWIRTERGSPGRFGFVIVKFGAFIREMALLQGVPSPPHTGISLWVVTALVLFGVVVALCSA